MTLKTPIGPSRAKSALSQTLLIALLATGLVPEPDVQPNLVSMPKPPGTAVLPHVPDWALAENSQRLPCMLCRYLTNELQQNANTICAVGTTLLCGAFIPRSPRAQQTCRVAVLYSCKVAAQVVQGAAGDQACEYVRLCTTDSDGDIPSK